VVDSAIEQVILNCAETNYPKNSAHYNCRDTKFNKNGDPTIYTGNYYIYKSKTDKDWKQGTWMFHLNTFCHPTKINKGDYCENTDTVLYTKTFEYPA